MGHMLIIKGADFSSVAIDTVAPAGDIHINVVSNNELYGEVTGGGYYNTGQSITIKAISKEGYVFVEWNDGDTNAERTIVVGSSDKTYTATFAKFGVIELLNGASWKDGYWSNPPSGTGTSANWQYTDRIDISSYIGKTIDLRNVGTDLVNTSQGDWCWIQYNDGSKKKMFIEVGSEQNMVEQKGGHCLYVIEPNARYIYIGKNKLSADDCYCNIIG